MPPRPVDRYRAGKGVEEPSDSESEYEEEPLDVAAPVRAPAAPVVKDISIAAVSAPVLAGDDVSSAYEEDDGPDEESDSNDSYESEDEYTEEEEEEAPAPVLLKPTFVSKSKKTDEGEREEEQRKQQTRKMLEEALEREQTKDVEETNEAEIDDADGVDPQAEREAWKLRELLRIQRERERVEQREKEREEIEERRRLDPEQRDREDRERARLLRESKPKKSLGFMQKYYHKGAFYQEQDILQRDYSQATEGEAIDKTFLPKPMQVRGDKYGRAGQTRWTHLVDQDTSSRDDAWNTVSDSVTQRLGGIKDIDDPYRKKRRTG